MDASRHVIRARGLAKRLLLPLAPTITCERCGQPLFHVWPVIANGRLMLYGAEAVTVEVAWSSKRTLRFRHEALDRCRREVSDERLLRAAEMGRREP